MSSMNLTAIEAKPFVPASDFERAKEFYAAIGFEIPWSSGDLAYVRHGETAFLLQAFDHPAFIGSFQMHLLVENADDWHTHLKSLNVEQRFGVRMGAPEDQPWAMRDFTLFDPSGVLWRIAHNLPRPVA
jgi:catechol 2,3-dioxygenase-like lactoylglutathione lyase family enzyme